MANEAARQEFFNRLGDLHNKDDLTDFVIVCGDRRCNVHRLVLALHSDVLSRACANGFKESREKSIDLSADHEPNIVDALVEYMYTLDYFQGPLDETETIRVHINLAILADKYNIAGLHELATASFGALLPVCPTSLVPASALDRNEGMSILPVLSPIHFAIPRAMYLPM